MAGVGVRVLNMMLHLKIVALFLVALYCMDLLGVDCAPLTTCSVGQFLDVDTGLCEFCSIMCESADIQGTMQKCLNNCPDYPQTTPVPAPDNHTTPASTTPNNRAIATADGVAIATPIVVVALIAAIAALIYKQKLYSLIQDILYKLKLLREDMKYPVQEVAEEEGGSGTVTGDQPQPDDNLIDPDNTSETD